jgi:homoserine O-acetyltransferase
LEKILQYIPVQEYTTESGFQLKDIQLSYQLFGQRLKTAPVVLVNHALSGNSDVAGENGWWKELIGKGKPIDTERYTVIAFNIPGNGYDGFLIENYKAFIARDIAKLFLHGLEKLEISQLHSIIGGSLGGGLAWEMICLQPDIAQHIIPIASDWKSTDWLIANCCIQEQFLLNSAKPVHDARMHAMLCYRTPASFKQRFQRSINETLDLYNVESWLLHHGEKLQARFQ